MMKYFISFRLFFDCIYDNDKEINIKIKNMNYKDMSGWLVPALIIVILISFGFLVCNNLEDAKPDTESDGNITIITEDNITDAEENIIDIKKNEKDQSDNKDNKDKETNKGFSKAELEKYFKENSFLYENKELGFSIRVPNTMYSIDRCDVHDDMVVPVKVFENNDNGTVYIVPEYFYFENGETAKCKERASDTDNANLELKCEKHEKCNKIEYSLDYINHGEKNVKGVYWAGSSPWLGWLIRIKNVKQYSDLNDFAKEIRGPGCFVEKGKEWTQEGIHNVLIKGEDWETGANLGNTTCNWSGAEKFLYYPSAKKFMYIRLGQEPSFYSEDPVKGNSEVYDDLIVNSFRFIK